MGRQANPTLIGAFLIGAVALIVIGILVFARGQFLTEKRTFVLYFDGSVAGLNVGAPVDFQGGEGRVGQRYWGAVFER